LLDIEIDRRRPDALAILGRRDDAHGKSRPRHVSATRATVNRGLMFGDHKQALGNVENLPLLSSRRRPRIEPRTAIAASAGLVSNHGVDIAHLPQSAPFVARLAAARLAGTSAQTSRDARFVLQPVARRRLGAIRTVQIQTPLKFGNLRPKRRYLRPQRSYQMRDFGRDLHPTLDSDSSRPVGLNPKTQTKFADTVAFRTHPGLGVTSRFCGRGFRVFSATAYLTTARQRHRIGDEVDCRRNLGACQDSINSKEARARSRGCPPATSSSVRDLFGGRAIEPNPVVTAHVAPARTRLRRICRHSSSSQRRSGCAHFVCLFRSIPRRCRRSRPGAVDRLVFSV
jgi:hypothetical protein